MNYRCVAWVLLITLLSQQSLASIHILNDSHTSAQSVHTTHMHSIEQHKNHQSESISAAPHHHLGDTPTTGHGHHHDGNCGSCFMCSHPFAFVPPLLNASPRVAVFQPTEYQLLRSFLLKNTPYRPPIIT